MTSRSAEMENLILFVFIDACAVYNNCSVKILGLNVNALRPPLPLLFFKIKNLPVSGNILDSLYYI